MIADKIDATSAADVRKLADHILAMTTAEKITLAAGLVQLGLFRLPVWMRPILAFKRHRLGADDFAILRAAGVRYPRFPVGLVKSMADHIVRGRDREDPTSAGGLSQREIDTLVGLIALVKVQDQAGCAPS